MSNYELTAFCSHQLSHGYQERIESDGSVSQSFFACFYRTQVEKIERKKINYSLLLIKDP